MKWLLTVIVTKRVYLATSVQLTEDREVWQGCHILNLASGKQVVTSPAVQFRPVPLTKRLSFSGPGVQTQQPVTLLWTRPSSPQSSVAHTYKGGPRGKTDNEASHINDGSSPLSVFLLYFAEIITMLVVETNRYYHDYIDRLGDGPSPELDVTEAEMFVFLTFAIQMGHDVRDKLTLLGKSGPAIHTVLRLHDETGPIHSHPSLLTFY